MSGGGSKPGERRGGRQKGTKNRKTVEREIIEAGIAAPPPMGKATLEKLLTISLTRMDEAMGGGARTYEAFLTWFDRTFHVARELTKFQSPQLRAVAVAHTDMRPPVLDLKRLSVKQLDVLAQLVHLAGPANVAGGERVDEQNADPLAIADGRPGSPTKSRDAALSANGRRVPPASGALGPLRKRSAHGPVSATPTSSDGASANRSKRRKAGSLLDADLGSRSDAD